jgi:oligopeptidase A
MQLDTLAGMDIASLANTHQILSNMDARTETILSASELTEASFVELTAIYDNLAYVFLYLESNEQFVDYRPLLPFRDGFFRNDERDRRLLAMCERLCCTDLDIEQCRRAFVAHLVGKATADRGRAAELEELQERAKQIVLAGQQDQLAFLARLGADTSSGSADGAAYTVLSATADAARRTKLARALTALRDKRLEPLLETVDRMVTARRHLSREAGFPTVLAQTMRRCRVSVEVARGLVEDYLSLAIEEHVSLESEVRAAVGDVDPAVDHFGYYVRGLQRGRTVPLFDLDRCLNFIQVVVARVFGVRMRQLPDTGPHHLAFSVSQDDEVLGYVNFDLWDAGRGRAANATSGIRNRLDWGGMVQLPIAYVSCRFHRRPDGRDMITFQNVHSLFHEIGHAINHVLIRKRLPTLSGLNYLPLERIEDLSMWTEKWVYHPDFVDHLQLSADERDGVEFCQRVKVLEYRRTHVDRAVTAALDFAVHGATDGGLRTAYDDLDARFGISRYCSLGDFPVYFARPMINANPGTTFAYTRGAAASAEVFAPMLHQRLDDLSPAQFADTFTACFDFDAPSSSPDLRAIVAFYEDVLRRPAS